MKILVARVLADGSILEGDEPASILNGRRNDL